MWMNSHERRVAIRLRAIPQGSVVQTFEEGDRKHVVFEGLDEVEMITMLSVAGVGRARVPEPAPSAFPYATT
jgi:hypothetical protein